MWKLHQSQKIHPWSAGLGLATLGVLLCFSMVQVGCGPKCATPKGKQKVTLTKTSGECPTPPAMTVDFDSSDSGGGGGDDGCKVKADEKACSATLNCTTKDGDTLIEMQGSLKIESLTRSTGTMKVTVKPKDSDPVECTFDVLVTP